MLISIGIFAHNEERDIGTLISDLAKQNLLANKGLSIEIHVVANGCTDNTVGVSKAALTTQPFHREKILQPLFTIFHVQENPMPGMNSFTGSRHQKLICFFSGC